MHVCRSAELTFPSRKNFDHVLFFFCFLVFHPKGTVKDFSCSYNAFYYRQEKFEIQFFELIIKKTTQLVCFMPQLNKDGKTDRSTDLTSKQTQSADANCSSLFKESPSNCCRTRWGLSHTPKGPLCQEVSSPNTDLGLRRKLSVGLNIYTGETSIFIVWWRVYLKC